LSSQLALLNLSGHDEPGLLGRLTALLACHDVRVLDLGHAVIHDELSLGMLLDVSAVRDPDELARALSGLAEGLKWMGVEPGRYDAWVGRQGQPRFILTLLSGGLSGAALAAVMEIVARFGLSVVAMRRLSERPPRSDVTARATLEIQLKGELRDPAGLKAALLEAGTRLVFDFSIQRDSVYRRHRRLVVFDMDSTLIGVEVIDELARLHGVGDEVAAITDRAMHGEIDFKTSFRERVALLEGLPEETLRRVAEEVPLTEGAQRLVATLKHFGYTTAIVSGGFVRVGEYLQRALGIDHVFANRLEMREGVATGDVEGDIVDAEGKARLLRALCEREDIKLEQAIAIGDGANDLPMLDAAGLGVAFHAKAVVRETADHAISNFGLDSVLYLMGFSDRDIGESLSD